VGLGAIIRADDRCASRMAERLMIMGEQEKQVQDEQGIPETRLAGWVRFYAVIFRIVLVLGLLALIAAIALLLVSDLFSAWILLLPAVLIILGLVLARVEYRLDMRLYHFHRQVSPDEEN